MSEFARAFRVELCGMQKKDRNDLKRIFAITEGRTRTYSLVDSPGGEQTDILIVNADNPEAKDEWNHKYVGTNGISMCATILASRNKLNDSQYTYTSLPFFPTRVLKCLDEVTVKELKYTPELRIEEPPKETQTPTNIRDYKTQLSNQELETFIDSRTDTNANHSKHNVLVVDDSRPVRNVLDIKLRLMDYAVQHAANGREALWLLQKTHFDSIFLDVVMPGIDGYEVCKQIKRNKATRHIPVIMLTSRSSQLDKVKGKLAGCDTYLTKPVEHDKFEKVVTGFLM